MSATTAIVAGVVRSATLPFRPLLSQSPFWVDPSGTALLAGWSLGVKHFGVMSKGKFTPLPVPSAVAAVTQTAIAW